MFSKILFSLVVLFCFVDYATGSCGICQRNFMACHSELTFSLCVDGKPTNSIVACPVNTVCTDRTEICVSKIDESVKPTCITGCGICGSYKKVFSCISQTQFAFCFGEDDPFYVSVGSCLDGYVCDLSSREICVKDTDSKPSCNEGLVTPTANPIGTGDPSESTTNSAPGSTSSLTTKDPSVTDPPGGGSSSTTKDPTATDPPGGGSSSTTKDPTATDPPGGGSSSTTKDPMATDPPGGGSSSTTKDPAATDPPGGGSSSTTKDPTATDPPGGGSSSTTKDPTATDPPGGGSSSTTKDPTAIDPPGGGSSSTTKDPTATDPPGGGSSSTTKNPSVTDPPGGGSSSTTKNPSVTDPPGGGSSSTTKDPTATDPPGGGSSSTSKDPTATDTPGGGSSSTSPNSNPTTTTEKTTHAPRDANTFCAETAISGTFPAEGDPTCTKYYICTTYNGAFRGYDYTCPTETYFNRETKQCQREYPDTC